MDQRVYVVMQDPKSDEARRGFLGVFATADAARAAIEHFAEKRGLSACDYTTQEELILGLPLPWAA